MSNPTPAQSFPVSSEPLDIAIIGAGLTGLTLALSISALPPHKQSHLRYTIYESHHSYSEIGAGIGFGASGHRIMKLLHPDFWESYKAIANWGDDDVWWDFVVGDRLGSSQDKHGRDGEWEGKRIAQVRMKEGREGQSTAHRRSLMDVLIKLLPPSADVRFGKRLTGITSSSPTSRSDIPESKVTLQFQDGTTSTADLVIGADGVKSLCRDIVLTPTNNADALKARFTGKIAYRGLIPMEEAKASIGEKAGQRIFYLGHGGHVVSFPVEGGKSMNIVAFANREEGVWEGSWVRENVEEELGRDYLDGRWGRDVEGIMRVIEDVYILTTLLSHLPYTSPHSPPSSPSSVSTQTSNLPALFAAYTQTRQPRATTAVSTCNHYGRILDMEDRTISDNLPLIAEKVRSIADTIWGYDEIAEGERGVRIMMGMGSFGAEGGGE
ncbi:hypothetical protein OCU04_006174 [Sclerotinia nivalis]|uniref:FAD-binding domain-containing protein n=1 Tax=Sclerotinia nivalis TaxID=352851 RepID=A0A9X0DLX3_9HELO|nr:hypothetical protein OCU04_006174 [Sclerotinia nivalis]